MKLKALVLGVSAAFIAGSAATTFADDSEMMRRNVSSSPGLTEDPEPEGEHAFIKLMNFHVPAQSANGELRDDTNPLSYVDIDGLEVKTEVKAKPLINVYVYGPVIGFDDHSQSGFPGHGRRDSFGAVSLDDGETWKVTNLSNSADISSFEVSTPLLDPGEPAGSGSVIEVDDPDGAIINEVEWEEKNNGGKLHVHGDTNTDSRERVTIRDAVTQEELFTIRSSKDGEFEKAVNVAEVPCWVQAGVDDVFGPAIEVPLEEGDECVNPDTGGEDTYITDYPGDVTNVFHAVAGNRALVTWQSKYCAAGFPGYTGGTISDAEVLAGYLGINNEVDLYLTDMFVVGGSQQSTDYREQEAFPGEYDGVGEVPYNCLWSARGVLREDPEELGTSQMVWFQAERLTSGRRDVNRVETSCTAGGGCAISWQEDPEGLRPGEGEGPGTGWAGATTNSKTEIWYSFVEWEDMDVVEIDGNPEVLADQILATGRPKPYVPMMVPVRLSNNDRCSFPVIGDASYCEEAFAGPYGIKDQCVGTVSIPLGPQGNLQDVCVVDQNDDDTMNQGDLPNLANTAASRPRLNLQPRDSDGDGVTDDAWVVIIHEEDKGLGRYGFLNDEEWDGNLDTMATDCLDPDADATDNCVKADVGKNQFYISFALGTPQTSAALEEDFGLVNNLVAQQAMYNAPENNWRTGDLYPPMSTEQMWDFGDLNYTIFNTEIARRASLMTQPMSKALNTNEDEALMAMPLFKEGIINQGGPADIMARRVAITLTGGGDRCDDVGGVQPFIDDAILICTVEDEDADSEDEVEYEDCQIEITGEVCVEGNNEGTEIILDAYSGGDANLELCEDFISIDVEDGTTFTGICELEDDQVEEFGLPCSVKVVVGPGSTQGQGQVSDPAEVEDGTDLNLLDGCYDAVEGE